MPEHFQFAVTTAFRPEEADALLRTVPAAAGVFALYGARATDAPYLTQTTDMRRRMRRLLQPSAGQTRRLNLRDKVVQISYTVVGSEFEAGLLLYQATRAVFGPAEARRRLKLRTPYCLRLTLENAFPRLYVTNRLSRRGLQESFGPFPSRAAAERACDAVLDLFLLRRCHEELAPFPEHPGCVYGEMKRCLEPCKAACTATRYAEESARVLAFLESRGASLLEQLEREREAASEAMEFERAASLHAQWLKTKAAAASLDELVAPLTRVRALVVQAAAHAQAPEAAIFLLEQGRLVGPARLSTLGVRAVREQAEAGSSLFAQPLLLAPVPEAQAAGQPGSDLADETPEAKATSLLAGLQEQAHHGPVELAERSDALALLRRWYFRPEKQRTGEVVLPRPDGGWPVRRVLRAAARAALGNGRPATEPQDGEGQTTPVAQSPV
ncbi:MAG: UvrB/UvrC motif-containing protein [Acidobacteriota bacterium]|nr:UvrB/UvrC motif-containing protein [Acidobacteriota bacterium]